jgi:hypothetical protein
LKRALAVKDKNDWKWISRIQVNLFQW